MSEGIAPALMVQGTASSVGKSLLVAALCRHFHAAGVRVAPFKAQNLALNSAVTPEGYEIGRAQALQAEACGLPAQVEMNPVLIKPESRGRAQVVLRGRPVARLPDDAGEALQARMREAIADGLLALRGAHELVIIEGAGSPAEVNLKQRDLANMYVARLADAPVILVGDIDRGGVFASLVGTLSLLDDDERSRVAALVLNKFRGELSLLQDGLSFLEARTGTPVLGVVPFLHDLGLADEDSTDLSGRGPRAAFELDVAVVRLPHISNYDDVLPLERDHRVRVRFVDHADALGDPDLVVLPGTKSTLSDLAFVRARGFEPALRARAGAGRPVLGICGGCQMLGAAVEDPHGVEGDGGSAPGLGLLPLRTFFGRDKVTASVRARVAAAGFLAAAVPPGASLTGYEIHMGRVEVDGEGQPAFLVEMRNAGAASVPDGLASADGAVVGTLLHGLLDNAGVVDGLVRTLGRARRGDDLFVPSGPPPDTGAALDRLRRHVETALDLDLLWKLALGRPLPR